MVPSTRPARFSTLDPGLNASGLACWEGTRLYSVTLLRIMPRMHLKGCSDRIEVQKQLMIDYLFAQGFEGYPVIGERMRHRPMPRGAKRKAYIDPQDLINLNLLSGALCDAWVEPADWKGTTSRETEQDHTACDLSNAELALVDEIMPDSLRKEAWSAVGIGLSLLERTHKKFGWRFT